VGATRLTTTTAFTGGTRAQVGMFKAKLERVASDQIAADVEEAIADAIRHHEQEDALALQRAEAARKDAEKKQKEAVLRRKQEAAEAAAQAEKQAMEHAKVEAERLQSAPVSAEQRSAQEHKEQQQRRVAARAALNLALQVPRSKPGTLSSSTLAAVAAAAGSSSSSGGGDSGGDNLAAHGAVMLGQQHPRPSSEGGSGLGVLGAVNNFTSTSICTSTSTSGGTAAKAPPPPSTAFMVARGSSRPAPASAEVPRAKQGVDWMLGGRAAGGGAAAAGGGRVTAGGVGGGSGSDPK
jgi:hypothetical protein